MVLHWDRNNAVQGKKLREESGAGSVAGSWQTAGPPSPEGGFQLSDTAKPVEALETQRVELRTLSPKLSLAAVSAGLRRRWQRRSTDKAMVNDEIALLFEV